jgi:hypothetical protein
LGEDGLVTASFGSASHGDQASPQQLNSTEIGKKFRQCVTQRSAGKPIDIVKARLAGLHKPVNPYDTQD